MQAEPHLRARGIAPCAALQKLHAQGKYSIYGAQRACAAGAAADAVRGCASAGARSSRCAISAAAATPATRPTALPARMPSRPAALMPVPSACHLSSDCAHTLLHAARPSVKDVCVCKLQEAHRSNLVCLRSRRCRHGIAGQVKGRMHGAENCPYHAVSAARTQAELAEARLAPGHADGAARLARPCAQAGRAAVSNALPWRACARPTAWCARAL